MPRKETITPGGAKLTLVARMTLIDTNCRFASGSDRTSRHQSALVNGRGINEHNGDVILNRVDSAALAAFQAGALRPQEQRLLADRAYEHI
jgi:hypothetical protein